MIEQRREETKQDEWKKQQMQAEMDQMQAQEQEVGENLRTEYGQKPVQTMSACEETGKEQPAL